MLLHQHTYKLWLLVLVRRNGSLAGASQEARLSSSAVSQAISQLEELLSFPLLVRLRKGIKLTPECEALLDSLEPALNLLETFDPGSLALSLPPRRLRIGAYESIAIDLLPHFVPILRERWPRMDIEIEIARSRILLEKCRQNEIDLVFVADATYGPNLHVRSFATESYGVFVARKSYVGMPAAEIVNRIGFGALKIDDRHHTRSFRRFLKNIKPALRPTLETENFEVILALVRGGAIAGALPLRVADRVAGELRRIDPVVTEGETDSGEHQLSLVCHESFSKPMFDTILGIALQG